MRNNKFKSIALLGIFILSLGIIGCSKSFEEKETSNELKVNSTTILNYKGSYVGDNSAVGNIINNLPGNIYNKGIELQTASKPYEITVHYKEFKDTSIKFEDNSLMSASFSDLMENNALIIFSLIKNVDIVNFKIDDGTIMTYERAILIDAYKDEFGDNLEKITKDKSTLENFIKTNKESKGSIS